MVGKSRQLINLEYEGVLISGRAYSSAVQAYRLAVQAYRLAVQAYWLAVQVY